MAGLSMAKPIPNGLIRKQLVQHGGKAFLMAENKLARTEDHEVLFSFEIAPFGKELRNPRVYWTGPKALVKVTESDILKDGKDSLYFTWNVDPLEVIFQPNQYVSVWGDGLQSLRNGYIQMSPIADKQAYLSDETNSWCYRFVLTAESYDRFNVILETVPTTLDTLRGCPWAESLVTGGCEIDRWNLSTSQSLPSEYGPGILPLFHDTRLPKYEKESLLPESQGIRLKVWETLSSMGTSAALDENDLVGYDPSNKKSPSFPEITLIEEEKCDRKRKSLETSTDDAGRLSKISNLLVDFLGGSMSEDEIKALGAAVVNEKDSVEKDKVDEMNKRSKSDIVTFDTPASIGMDVSGLLSRMPSGTSRDQVRHMTFKDIDRVMKMSENMGVEDRTEALYRAVTETKTIPAEEHNRSDILHSAMFFPSSMAAPEKYWAKCVPSRVDPHVTGIPLAHVGLENEVAPLAIEKAGDKTKRLYIRYFLQNNVNVQQKQPKFKTQRGQDGVMGLSMDENWQEAQKVSEIQDAVFAYLFVMADLHPRDFGPRNLLRLMHKLDWLSFRKDQLFALKLVIDGVLGRYHYLACQKKPPLSYKELQDFVTSTLEAKGGPTRPADVSLLKLTKDDWGKQFYQNDGRDRGRGGLGGRRGNGNPSAAAGFLASSGRSAPETPPLCHSFNSSAGCPREPSGRRCYLPSGRCLLHLCSKTDAKGEECLAAHAKPDHK